MVIPFKGEGADAMEKAMQSAQKLMDGTEKMLQSINNIIVILQRKMHLSIPCNLQR